MGIGSHWDEWYLHEASENDRLSIKEAGRTESTQRQFIAWLFLYWTREAIWPENRLTPRFVVGQLAQVPPFNQWSAFKEYRASYGLGGLSAIVLAEGSLGNQVTFGRSKPSRYRTIQVASHPRSCPRAFKRRALYWTSRAGRQ